jgi:uncharacterized protein (TIGR02147 family)
MTSVFDYTDYRKYLKDYYKEKKAVNPGFSYQLFADKAGFKDKSCIFGILKGKRHLSKSGIYKISKAINHNKYEAEYFENLVSFNKAKELNERNHFFDRINNVKNYSKGAGNAKLVRMDQYEYYANWYHSAIRSLIDMYNFKDDYKWLAKMVYPRITPRQARLAVELLERLGMIIRQKNGIYKVSDKSITTGKYVLSLAVQNFHVECASLASKAIKELPRGKRNITGLTLGISKKSYERICEEVQTFQEKIMDIANKDDEADRVYFFNFHLFPGTGDERNKK